MQIRVNTTGMQNETKIIKMKTEKQAQRSKTCKIITSPTGRKGGYRVMQLAPCDSRYT